MMKEFLAEVAKDPISKQALADAIAAGALPTENGVVSFSLDGLAWMERREGELRTQAN
jgi:hypothetical protein